MKTIFKYLSCSAVVLAAASLLPSCSMEEPFAADGEGSLTITTEINGDVIKTRTIEADELATLRENCVVYIENNRGVVRKFKGLDNIPESIKLQTGAYVAEAWSGDSVSASFDAKFYRGKQEFVMAEGQNSLTLKCNIANVLVSVDPASLNVDLTDLKVTFYHSRGQLEFTKENIPTAKGYFMMPNADKDLNYKIEGKKLDGSAYVREGKIENVQRAHEYCMTITQNENEVTDGGAFITIKIADIPLIEETVEIFPGPSVNGLGFNIDEQVASIERNFSDTHVYVKAYQGLSSVILSFSDNFPGMVSGRNILDGSVKAELAAKGITFDRRSSSDAASSAEGDDVEVDEIFITFSKAFLDALPVSGKEFAITIDAVDGRHREGSAKLRIANSADAVEVLAPVSTVAPPVNDPLAIGAHSATISGIVNDASLVNRYGIKYRPQGTSAWTAVYADASLNKRTRAVSMPYSVTIKGLDSGKTYEYISFSDDYDSPTVMSFTTESEFKLTNASFEDWSSYSASTLLGTKSVILPGSTNNKSTSFWGSGNEGAATASLVLTDKYEGLVHSGKYSARLASNKAFGVLAAGNIFIGEYVKTDGTNGVLSVGRQYNGSHPTKVRVYCNYRPGVVDILKNNNLDIKSGGKDHGQIYIGLTDGPVELRTKDLKIFTPDDPQVLAYGQVTFTDDYGANNELKAVEITFNYNDRAKTKRPTHIVIVATAAKFGDYFSGSSSSVMILDDFELIYE